ncbi:hypothetical protein VNO80_16484 [Phaseolus coccineus]|uniref:KOW domain-containing protein n=1 Tax=Phaseolus coccineus TaxID=3886 RepID=A0AAN9R389_PHACN
MVKFLKRNKKVIVVQGRYAGKKAVIVRTFDEGTRERPYGHFLVAGIKKYPSMAIKKNSARKSLVKAFIKLVNYRHLMSTRYTLDVDLKNAVSSDVLHAKDKKVTALKERPRSASRIVSKPARTDGSSPSSGSEQNCTFLFSTVFIGSRFVVLIIAL